MALLGLKLSELSTLAKQDLSSVDRVMVLDKSDPTMGPEGTNKQLSIEDLIGPIYNVNEGHFQAGKALIADGDAKIAGVSENQLARLNVELGEWTAGKVLTINDDGKLETVTKQQFQALDVVAGHWQATKTLVVDGDGKLAGVSLSQFQTLDVDAGMLVAGKCIVLDANQTASSANLTLNASSQPQISLADATDSFVVTKTSLRFTDGAKTATLTKTQLSFESGAFPTVLKYNLLQMASGVKATDIVPETITLQDGTNIGILTSGSLRLNASDYKVELYAAGVGFSIIQTASLSRAEVTPTQIKVIDGPTNKRIVATYAGLEILDGSNPSTKYQYNQLYMKTANKLSEIRPSEASFLDGAVGLTITPTSFEYVATTLRFVLAGLPTADPRLPNQVWKDDNGYLRISQG